MKTFQEMIGKTVAAVKQQKLAKWDDEGFLRVEFTDGTHCTIVGGCGGYTGDSEGEYITRIEIADEAREAQLVDIPNSMNTLNEPTASVSAAPYYRDDSQEILPL
jgi:hypothetical protein